MLIRSKKYLCLFLAFVMVLPFTVSMLSYAQGGIPIMEIDGEQFELSLSPYENSLGLMISAEDAADAFSLSHNFDTENKAFIITDETHGKIVLMHNATRFYSGSNIFDCLPYFYVENGVPMVEIGFFCEMFNSSYDYDKHENTITVFKDVPKWLKEKIGMNSEDVRTMSSGDTKVGGRLSVDGGLTGDADVGVTLVVTPRSRSRWEYRQMYGGGIYQVEVFDAGTPFEIGNVDLTGEAPEKNYSFPVLDTGAYPYYMLGYVVHRDSTKKLSQYGACKTDGTIYEMSDSPLKGMSSTAYKAFDYGKTSNADLVLSLKSNVKPNTSSSHYDVKRRFKARDIAKKYNDNNIYDITYGDQVFTTNKDGYVQINTKTRPETFSIRANGYLPLVNVPSKYGDEFSGNLFVMYKEGFSGKPVIHAAKWYSGSGALYNPGRIWSSNRATYYSGDVTSKGCFAVLLSDNGNEVASVKFVQGDIEIPLNISSSTATGTYNGKTNHFVIAEAQNIVYGMELPTVDEPVYIVITTKSGDVVKEESNLWCIKKPDEKIDVDTGGEFEFKGDDDASGEGKSILGGTQLKYKLFDTLPASLKLTPIKGGGYTFKGTLGIESKNPSTSYGETELEDVINQVKACNRSVLDDKYSDGQNPAEKFKNYFKKLKDSGYTEKSNMPQAEFGKSFDLQGFGYVEGEILSAQNQYKTSVTDGGFIFKVSFDYDVTRQTILYGAPVYWTAGLGFEDAISMSLIVTDNLFSNEFEASIRGGIGVGLKGTASVGAISGEGRLNITCEIPIDPDTAQAIISGNINFIDYEVGVISGSLFSISTPELQLYPEIKVLSLEEDAASVQQANEPRQLSRVYTQKPLEFNAGEAGLMAAPSKVNHTVIASNTYTFSTPQLTYLDDGRLLLVWTEDDRDRESDADRTALHYSIYDNGTWSDPRMVNDDGTADFNPVLKNTGDNVYLIWRNATENFAADETDVNKIANSLETSVARFNGSDFENLGGLGNKGVILSDITEVNGKPTVVWTESASNDQNQSAADTVMKSAEYANGKWTVNQLLSGQTYIDSVNAAENNGSLEVYYSQDIDGDLTTSEDKDVFVHTGSGTKCLTGKEAADTKPVADGNYVVWYTDSGFACMDRESGKIEYIEANILGDSFDFASSENESVITYSVQGDEGVIELYAVCNDGNGWGEPILMASTEKFVSGRDLIVTEDGFKLLTDEIIIEDNNIGEASLNLYEVNESTDLALTELTYDEYSINGDTMWLTYEVTNKGVKTVDDVYVRVYDDSEYLASQRVKLDILPGTTKRSSISVDAGDYSKLRVNVTPYSGSDADLSNNDAEVELRLSDISVDDLNVEYADGKAIVQAFVSNLGRTVLDGVEVSLHKQTPDGEVVDTVKTGQISANGEEVVEFALETYDEGIYYVVCEELEDEDLLGNNSEFIYLSRPQSDGGYYYEQVDGGARITGVEDPANEIEIPSHLYYLAVKEIGAAAFMGYSNITSVTLPDTVAVIGDEAFMNCSGLKRITIPYRVTDIGENAFTGCENFAIYGYDETYAETYALEKNIPFVSLGKVPEQEYPGGSCGDDVIWKLIDDELVISGEGEMTEAPWLNSVSSSIKSVAIKDGVTSICDSAFYNCTGITAVEIGDSVKAIGKNAFYGCAALSDIKMSANIVTVGTDAFAGTAYCNDAANWTDNVLYIGTCLAEASSSVGGNYAVQENTTCIGGGAFSDNMRLTGIELPESLLGISDEAFVGCSNLRSVIIPDSVIYIGESAFEDCYTMTSAELGSGLKYLGAYAFCGCEGLSKITGGGAIAFVGTQTLDYTSFYDNDANWSDNMLYIGSNLIYAEPNLNGEISVKDGTTAVPEGAFNNCINVTVINIPASVTVIGNGVFSQCLRLEKIKVSPENLNYVDDDGILFGKDRKLIISYPAQKTGTEYTVPNGITEIARGAFSNNSYLETLIIYPEVSNIHNGAIESKIDNFRIMGYPGSAAEDYSEKNEIDFEPVTGASPEITSVSVEKTGQGVTVKIVGNNIPANAVLVAAGYSADGKVVALSRAADGKAELDAENIKTVKVFCWRSIESMKPFCEVKTVSVS